MKKLIVSIAVSAFVAAPAFACEFGKTASYEKPLINASKAEQPAKADTAMTTVKSAKKPIFEEVSEIKMADAGQIKTD